MAELNAQARQLYDARIRILEARENAVLASMIPEAKKAITELLNLTSESKQQQELNAAIKELENLIDENYIATHSVAESQSHIAQKILALDKELQILGKDGSTQNLQYLAAGQFDKVTVPATGTGVTLVANSDLNKWLLKILQRVNYIKTHNESKKFTGYLSNLKGEYLEQAIVAELQKYLPIDAVVQGGTMTVQAGQGARARQIEEDIFLVYKDSSKESLSNILNDKSFRTKKGRISISVPIYEKIQHGAAGISVKAGTSPIKFYEGNLDAFFAADNSSEVQNYRQNVLMRSVTGHTDNEKGATMNRYVVSLRLDLAVGSNNLFLATRNKMLTTMSKELALIRDKGGLSMYYNLKNKAASKAKSGGTKMSSISGRIVAPSL